MNSPKSEHQAQPSKPHDDDAVCCPSGATVRDVAKALGVSRATVLNLEKSAISKIKKAIKSHLPFGADLKDFF